MGLAAVGYTALGIVGDPFNNPWIYPVALLADLLATRLREAGTAPGDAVVLAAAGSTDPAASVDVAAMADLLRERVDGPVSVGFAAGGMLGTLVAVLLWIRRATMAPTVECEPAGSAR